MCENGPCREDEPRPRPLEAVRGFLRDLKESPIGEHARGVQRETLLLARSVFDFMISRIEETSKPEEPGRSGPVRDAD